MKKQIMILLVTCQLFGGAVFCMDKNDKFKSLLKEINYACPACSKGLQDDSFCGLSQCGHIIAHFDCIKKLRGRKCPDCEYELFFCEEDFESWGELKYKMSDSCEMSIDSKFSVNGRKSFEDEIFNDLKKSFSEGGNTAQSQRLLEASEEDEDIIKSTLFTIVCDDILHDMYKKLTDKEKEALGKLSSSSSFFKDLSSGLRVKEQPEVDCLKIFLGEKRFQIFEGMVKRIKERFFKEHGQISDAFNILKSVCSKIKNEK